jgi:hypothetical protein
MISVRQEVSTAGGTDFCGGIRIPQSSDFSLARATVCATFGVERPTVGATVVHLAREEVGDDRAQDENAAEDSDAQERILQPLYFSRNPRW